MKIGIIGAGSIGKTLARKLAAAGHDVKVSNSRGPETIDAEVLATGARAVATAEAVEDVDVVIVSIPPTRLRSVAPLLSGLQDDAVVIDTSNYYPQRDDRIEALEAGQVESLWFAEQRTMSGRRKSAWSSNDSTPRLSVHEDFDLLLFGLFVVDSGRRGVFLS